MEGYPLYLFLSRHQIRRGVQRLGREIRRDYGDSRPLLVAVLKGSFMFLADLARAASIPLTLDFVQAESYRSTSSTGTVKVPNQSKIPVRGKHLLLVEDIVDTGLTISHLMERFRSQEPASLKLCALLDKPSRRVVPVPIDYLGFTVPDRFVVGYGLDVDQEYRYLPDIYVLEET